MKNVTDATQVQFGATNGVGLQAIYLTNDPTLDTLAVTFQNTSGATIALTGGTPVSEGQIAPGGPSSLYLNFGTLLTSAEVEGLAIQSEGWNIVCFGGVDAYWALTPQSDMQFVDQQVITFTITNILATGQPRPGELSIDYYNLGGVDDDSVSITMQVENPPAAHRQLQLDIGFVNDRNVVYITDEGAGAIANSVTFYLRNPSPSDPILNKPPGAPAFTLSFVAGTAPGYGAIATIAEIADFSVAHGTIYKDIWQITPNTQGPFPYWTFTPQGSEILGTGDAATVEFVVSNIVTYLEPGITSLYVAYSGIPGYDDGSFSLSLQKNPAPAITQFTADPEATTYGSDTMQTTLTWATENADHVAIGSQIYEASGSTQLTVQRGQQITLIAYAGSESGTKDDAPQVTVSKTITIHGVSRADIDTGLAAVGWILTPPGGDVVYIVEQPDPSATVPVATRIAVMQRGGTSIIDTIDLNSALDPNLGTDNVILATCLARDGSTIYAMLIIGSNGNIAVIAIDTATNTLRVVMPLIGITQSLTSGSMIVGPTGTLFITYAFDLDDDSSSLVVIDLATSEEIISYNRPADGSNPCPGLTLMAVSTDGTRILTSDLFYLFLVEIADGVPSILSQTGIGQGAGGIVSPVISSDIESVYTLLSGDTNNAVLLLTMEIDSVTLQPTPGACIPIGRFGNGGPETITLSISPDNGTLAATTASDQLILIDAATSSVKALICGAGYDFAPNAIAVDNAGSTVYATGYDNVVNSTVQVVTMI